VKHREISRPIIMVDISATRDLFSIVCGKCLWIADSAGQEVSELEAGWRILVGKELQRKGAAKLKERLPVSSLTSGRRSGMTRSCYAERQCMLGK